MRLSDLPSREEDGSLQTSHLQIHIHTCPPERTPTPPITSPHCLPIKAPENNQQERRHWEHTQDSQDPNQKEAGTEERLRTRVSPMTAPRAHGRLDLKGSSSPPTGMTAGKAHSLTPYCCLVSVKHLLCARFWESKTTLELQSIWVGPISALFSIIILDWFPL